MDYQPIEQQVPYEGVFQATLQRVYVWMALGLLVTTSAAFVTVTTPLANLVANPIIFFGAVIAELALVFTLSGRLNRLAASTAAMMFLLYAALNGFTLSLIVWAYTPVSLYTAFFATACMFAATSIVAYTTRVDLTRLGGFLLMGLIGLIAAMVVNLFLHSDTLYWIVSLAGVALFIGLTAWDTQRIKAMVAQSYGGEVVVQRLSILGALRLYLDFVNLFLFILRLGGRRR